MKNLSEAQKQHKNEMIKFFEQKMKVKKAIESIENEVAKANPKDLLNYNLSLDVRCSNVRVFYAENKNYAFGGRGFYITNGKYTYKIKSKTLYVNANCK